RSGALTDNFRHDVFHFYTAEFFFITNNETMRENLLGKFFDLFDRSGIVAINRSHCLDSAKQTEGTTRAGAQEQGRVVARGTDDFQNQIINVGGYFDLTYRFLTF